MSILVIEGDIEKIKSISDAAAQLAPGIGMHRFDDGKDVVRYYGGEISKEHKRIRIVTFGDFNVFADGKPVDFRYSKAMELFAVLVNAAGRQVSPDRLRNMLWADNEPGTNHASYLSILKKDMIDTLRRVNAEDIIIRGEKGLSVDRAAVDCDYFDYIEDLPVSSGFDGRYMEQYSWAEPTVGELTAIERKRRADRA